MIDLDGCPEIDWIGEALVLQKQLASARDLLRLFVVATEQRNFLALKAALSAAQNYLRIER